MSTTAAASATIGIGAATALVKKIVDDLYSELKKVGSNAFGRSRANVRDASVAKAIVSITKVKTLWNIDREVSLYDFYYPAQISTGEESREAVNSLAAFDAAHNFVVEGTAGQGKSIFLRYLCGQELNPNTTSGRLPVYVELRRLRHDLTLTDLVLQALERYKLPHTLDFLTSLAASGKAVLLLDAFDEIDPTLVSKAISDLEHISDLYRDSLQIIVTSRPDADIQRSSRFRTLRLSKLVARDHAPFLRKVCEDREQSENLLKTLRDSPAEVTELLTTPLMLTLLVVLYKSIQTVPSTVPRFYEELFDVLFYRHDNNKPGFRRRRYTSLDDTAVKSLFSALCFYVRLQGLGTLTASQFDENCARAAAACKLNCDAKALKAELVKTICVLQEDGFELSFIHKSVAQYYASAFVASSSERFAEKFYVMARRSLDWGLELRFLEQIDRYRFAKYFTIPLIEEIAFELGIDLNSSSDPDPLRVSGPILSNLKIAVESAATAEISGTPPRPIGLLGWISDFERRDTVRSELVSHLSIPIIRHIESQSGLQISGIDIAKTRVAFLRLEKFGELPIEVVRMGSNRVATELRTAHSAAKSILQAEEDKIAMLASFSS